MQTSPVTPSPALPGVTVVTRHDSELRTRGQLIERKRKLRAWRTEAATNARDRALSAQEKDSFLAEMSDYGAEEALLEATLKSQYLPQHSPQQLINPRVFLASPLFRVAAKAAPRANDVEVLLAKDAKGHDILYSGPELRQLDGLVFMALINMARDVRLGSMVQFSPGELCTTLFGQYDGRSRNRLKEHIRRLQRGQVRSKDCTVQLCLRFEHPSQGKWSVALDPEIVSLFAQSPVWLDLKRRLTLPDGLTTWLYGYVEAQSSLIPMSVNTLRALCGAESEERAFMNSLRKALGHLCEHDVIDSGYQVKKGTLHWRKSFVQTANPLAPPSDALPC